MSATKKILTEPEALTVNQLMPGNKNVRMGERLRELQQKSLAIQKVSVEADATGAIDFLAEYSGDIVDAWVICRAASGSGTLTLRRATTDITSAMVCAVDDALARTLSLVQAENPIVQGETLNHVANGAADRGDVYIAVLRS